MTLFGDTYHNHVFVSLALIATIVSSSCSSSVLFMIKRMNVWNLHLSLIFAMTSFELMYDVFFFSCMVDTGNFPLTVISNIAVCLGGTTSSLLSNVIAMVALYVVYFRQTIDLMPYYYLIIAIASIPGMIVIIMYIMVLAYVRYDYLVDIGLTGIYYYTRLASIGINFVCSICTATTVYRMKSMHNSRSGAELAINRLATRMFYYPVVQAVGRSGCAWYEMKYGYNYQLNRTVNLDPPVTSDTEFAVQCWMAICIPLIAVGYLVIFLIMQPDASKSITAFLKDWHLLKPDDGSQTSTDTSGGTKTLEFTRNRLQSEVSVDSNRDSNRVSTLSRTSADGSNHTDRYLADIVRINSGSTDNESDIRAFNARLFDSQI